MREYLPLILSLIGGFGITTLGLVAGPEVIFFVVLSLLLSSVLYFGYSLIGD